jgi:hypothetical protein
VTIYLDDGIGGHINFQDALESSAFVKSILIEFVFFVVGGRKVSLVSLSNCQNKKFVTEKRISVIEKSIESVLYQIICVKCSVLPVRVLASFVGRLIALQFVFGNILRLITKRDV